MFLYLPFLSVCKEGVMIQFMEEHVFWTWHSWQYLILSSMETILEKWWLMLFNSVSFYFNPPGFQTGPWLVNSVVPYFCIKTVKAFIWLLPPASNLLCHAIASHLSLLIISFFSRNNTNSFQINILFPFVYWINANFVEMSPKHNMSTGWSVIEPLVIA